MDLPKSREIRWGDIFTYGKKRKALTKIIADFFDEVIEEAIKEHPNMDRKEFEAEPFKLENGYGNETTNRLHILKYGESILALVTQMSTENGDKYTFFKNLEQKL